MAWGIVPSCGAHRIFFQLWNLSRNAKSLLNPAKIVFLITLRGLRGLTITQVHFFAFWSSLKISGCSKKLEQHDLQNSGCWVNHQIRFFWHPNPQMDSFSKEWDDFKATWDAVKQHGPTGGAEKFMGFSGRNEGFLSYERLPSGKQT